MSKFEILIFNFKYLQVETFFSEKCKLTCSLIFGLMIYNGIFIHIKNGLFQTMIGGLVKLAGKKMKIIIIFNLLSIMKVFFRMNGNFLKNFLENQFLKFVLVIG